MENKSALTEDLGNMKFKGMLKLFQSTVKDDPKPETAKEKLDGLAQLASKSGDLTFRQAESVVDRCKNYLNGTYGNTKRPEHYEQGKPSTK